MKTEIEESIEILNELIATCGAGAHGFATAAEHVSAPELKDVFNNYAAQRRELSAELVAAVQARGGEPVSDDSVAGKMHRGWIGLRQALTGKEAHAILAECERGEDAAVADYREAIEALVDPDLREIVTRQFVRVKAAHDTVRDLRDSATYASR